MKKSKTERRGRLKTVVKIVGVAILAAVIYFYASGPKRPAQTIAWGVTFSPPYAEGLGLFWPEVYRAILDDLGADNLRLIAYWNMIESRDDQLDFRALDYQLQEAERRDVKVLLALGRRLPRWPECHEPGWVQNESEATKQEKLLEFIEAVVSRYKDRGVIWAWQIENEFFLRDFGDCPPADSDLLDEELALVRSLDDRPIVLTDSGELGGWIGSMRRADIFGTTVYRTIYNKNFGFASYPIAPVYYARRFSLMKIFGRAREIIDVELQAEPWSPHNSIRDDPAELWDRSLSVERFADNIGYAKATGIARHYLWGVEWWYYAKTQRGTSAIWDEAKKLWQD